MRKIRLLIGILAIAATMLSSCSEDGGDEIPGPPVVTFDANGGTVSPATAVVDEDGLLAELPRPEYDGYAFMGWYSDREGGEQISYETVFTADATIYAHWFQIVFTITFDANGGTVSPTSARTSNWGFLDELPTPTKDGYAFAGWFTAAEGGEKITVSYDFTADMTLYAQWVEAVYASKAEVGMYYYKDDRYAKTHLLATETNPVVGVILNVNAEGTKGLVISIDELEARWSLYEDVLVGAKSYSDGFSNMSKIVSMSIFGELSYPAVYWVHAKNENATAATYTAGAEKVWYLPAEDELELIYTYYDGFGKTEFNKILGNSEIEGAQPISTGYHSYHSSTEFSDVLAKSVDFTTGIAYGGRKIVENGPRTRGFYYF